MSCGGNQYRFEVFVTTDNYPSETSWELRYTDGTIIDGIGEGSYTEYNTQYIHEGCIDLDSCVTFTIFDSYGDGIWEDGGYVITANDVVMVEGGEFGWVETKTFCYGPSISSSPSFHPTIRPTSLPTSSPTSLQPSYSPTVLVCYENEFKYKVIVITDWYPYETSWELNYTNGTIIDNVEEGEYADYYYEYVHEGCVNFDSCVIFIIYDSFGDGICCSVGNGEYTIIVNDVVMAEGGEFGGSKTTEFCYPMPETDSNNNLPTL